MIKMSATIQMMIHAIPVFLNMIGVKRILELQINVMMVLMSKMHVLVREVKPMIHIPEEEMMWIDVIM